MLKIPIKVNETTTCGVNRGTAFADLIKRTKLFVWDESPLMSRYETVDRAFKGIMNKVDPKLEHFNTRPAASIFFFKNSRSSQFIYFLMFNILFKIYNNEKEYKKIFLYDSSNRIYYSRYYLFVFLFHSRSREKNVWKD